MNSAFSRVERLLGTDGLAQLTRARVILFGVGGVGGWCADALVRSGIGHLTLVDPDCVDVTNINRQLPATTRTVGRPKVEVLRERLLEINPLCDVTDKANLILEATACPGAFFSSMGAACKMDPTQVRVAEFFDVRGCPLGAALRKRLRKNGTLPAKNGPGKAVANGTLAPITGIFGFTLAGLAIEHIVGKSL